MADKPDIEQLAEACREALNIVADARRENRTISADASDAVDGVMSSLEFALTVLELEGGNDG